MPKVINLSASDAKKFFLEKTSYCTVCMPDYFCFDKMLAKIDNSTINYKSFYKNAKKYEDVNYLFYRNKDNKYSWRKFQLINPYIYVLLVDEITKENNWKEIVNRLQLLRNESKTIECFSDVTKSNKSNINSNFNQTSSVLNHTKLEKKMVELSLKYNFLGKTDISGCYDSIYTHTLAWAMHDKDFCKTHREPKYIGNKIDEYFMAMNNGQTNGIPQGNAVSDFVAELLFGYIDREIYNEIKHKQIRKYRILRYRDDYYVFSNSIQDVENILQILTKVLQKFNFKTNESKIGIYDDIIENTYKQSKIESMLLELNKFNKLYDKLLILKKYATRNKNSGYICSLLNAIYKEIEDKKRIPNHKGCIGILTDIMLNNNKSYQVCIAIIGKILSLYSDRNTIIKDINKKIETYSNNDEIIIWLQKITLMKSLKLDLKLPLCKAVAGEEIELWNNDWISDESSKIITMDDYIDRSLVINNTGIIESKDIDIFEDYFKI